MSTEKILWNIGGGLAATAGVSVFALNRYVNDYRIKNAATGFTLNNAKRVLLVFAHPDDEVMAAGTIAALKAGGATVHALYLTHGEDGPTGDLVPREQLAATRAAEIAEVGKILGYDTLDLLSYPDRSLATTPPAQLQEEVRARLIKYQPDTVITFDHTIGLYGHLDHLTAGLITWQVLAEDTFGVSHLLLMTLCNPMLKLALKMSQTFRERYVAENGLPAANFAVDIPRFAKQKHEVVKAHKTQWQVMGDVQPLWNKIPYWLYYQVFSREYFTVVNAAELGSVKLKPANVSS